MKGNPLVPGGRLVIRGLVLAALSLLTLLVFHATAGRQTLTSHAVYYGYGYRGYAPQAVLPTDYLAALNGDAYQWPKSKLPIKIYIGDGSNAPGYRPSMREILKTC